MQLACQVHIGTDAHIKLYLMYLHNDPVHDFWANIKTELMLWFFLQLLIFNSQILCFGFSTYDKVICGITRTSVFEFRTG